MIATEPGCQIQESSPWGHALGGDLVTNLFLPPLSQATKKGAVSLVTNSQHITLPPRGLKAMKMN